MSCKDRATATQTIKPDSEYISKAEHERIVGELKRRFAASVPYREEVTAWRFHFDGYRYDRKTKSIVGCG
jgi:hypothetical protein